MFGLLRISLVMGVVIALATPVLGTDFKRSRRQPVAWAVLDGFQEVPAAIFTKGRGVFWARKNGDTIEYKIRYQNLSGDVTAGAGVHIHFGRPGVNGGIAAFLCEAAVPAPMGTPKCVDDGKGSGGVKGTITAKDVLPIDGQGFPGGSIDDLWQIIRSGTAYVNLHTSAYPPGEIRGAIR